jgi:hypothetical protein
MRTKCIQILFILGLVITSSCIEKTKPTQNEKQSITIKEVNSRIKLSKLFSSINYIPLQTTNESLIGTIEKIYIKNNIIYMIDGFLQNTNIKTFTTEGQFIKEIGDIGKGPKEIMGPRDLYIYNDTLFIWDKKGIHSFSLSGEYQKHIFNAFLPGNNFFYWHNHFYLFHGYNKPGLLTRYNIKGKVLKIYYPIDYWLGGAEGEHINKINNNTFSLFSPNSDIIYYLKNDSLISKYEIKCKTVESFSKLLLKYRNLSPPERLKKINNISHYTTLLFLENKNYIYLKYIIRNKPYILIINKNTGKKVYFNDNINKGVYNDAIYITNENELVIPLYPYDILNYIKKHKNKLNTTKFYSIVKDVSSNDNPVLMFCKLKI